MKLQSCTKGTCDLCKIILPEWLSILQQNAKSFSIKKGGIILKQGDKVDGIYFISEGYCKVHKKWGDKELIVRFAKNGNIIGHRGLGKIKNFPISATALTNMQVCFIPLQIFKLTLQTNTQYLLAFSEFLISELQNTETHFQHLMNFNAKEKIAYSLCFLFYNFGEPLTNTINFPITKQDISAYIGIAYETAFKEISLLLEEGIITYENKYFKILKIEYLENIVQLAQENFTRH
jgi:CRP-like cAMP-binding protein